MDDRSFDTITRSLVRPATRRGLSRIVLAGFSVVGLAGLNPDTAGAACKKLGRRCVRGEDRCCGGAVCKKKRCQCAAGTRACRGRCIRADQCCVNADCNGGVCRNATCQAAPNQGICTADLNQCVNGEGTNCGPLCSCYVTLDGLSICGRNQVTCGCGANNDCAQVPGAVCVRQGIGCCALAGNTTCVLPCQDPD